MKFRNYNNTLLKFKQSTKRPPPPCETPRAALKYRNTEEEASELSKRNQDLTSEYEHLREESQSLAELQENLEQTLESREETVEMQKHTRCGSRE
jgi:hypothetical protein